MRRFGKWIVCFLIPWLREPLKRDCRCLWCGHQWAQLTDIDRATTRCPECGNGFLYIHFD